MHSVRHFFQIHKFEYPHHPKRDYIDQSLCISGCDSLRHITLPDGVKVTYGYAFQGCKGLTGINIPNGVTKIGCDVFADCIRLTSITIPSSVPNIRVGTFRNCRNLKEARVPKNCGIRPGAVPSTCNIVRY